MARPTLVAPPKPVAGDRVAIISPSFAAPALFPAVHELAMDRIRQELGLIPVEYPTTRQLGASAVERARDVMAAWADPSIRAVLATLGGDDQITLLPHLRAEVFQADPKPFFGYSDNTNLLNWLWNLGAIAYHGGSTMVHLGRGGAMHHVSLSSLRAAMFGTDEVQLTPVETFSEDEISWDSSEALTTSPPSRESAGWEWHNADRVIEGPTWGGNLEVLHWNLAAGRWIRPAEDYSGCVLLIETSEEMPSSTEVHRMLRNMGERGLLAQFPAVVVGRPKASVRTAPTNSVERAAYVRDQAEAVLTTVATYRPDALVVLSVDIGHTDPQWIVPYGGTMRIDGPARTIHVRY